MKGNTEFKVSLAKLAKELRMEFAYTPSDPDEIYVSSPNVNRPGIELTGILQPGKTSCFWQHRVCVSKKIRK